MKVFPNLNSMQTGPEGMNSQPVAQTHFGNQQIVPARIQFIDEVRDRFLGELNNSGMDGEGLSHWKLIITEAFTNAVRHGCGNDGDKHIRVQWSLGEGYVKLEIEDPGPGVPEPLQSRKCLPRNPMDEGGRGLFLIYSHCDGVSHWKSSDGYLLSLYKAHPGFGPESSMEQLVSQTMEELSSSYESLSAFYRLGESLIQADRVTSFLESALQDLKKLIPADHYSLCWEPVLDESLLQEVRRMEGTLLLENPSPVRSQVIGNKGEFVFEDPAEVEHDALFSAFACGCCLPIQAAGTVLATLQVGRDFPPVFIAKDLSTLKTYTDLFGIALAHANNTISRNREQQALREVQIAADLQNTLVPARSPAPDPDWTLFLQRMSARSVSGDYVEAIRLEDGRLLLVIADVMGKGVSAAFLAGMLRTAVRLISSLEKMQGLDALLHGLNKILCQMIGDLTLFATSALVLVSPEYDSVEVVNAGHCPVFVGRQNQILYQVEPSGTPLGIFPDQVYQIERFPLEVGQWILMVTDGLFEWKMNNDQIWGWDHFQQFVRENSDRGGAFLWQKLQDLRSNHTRESELEDDQTLLYWKRNQ